MGQRALGARSILADPSIELHRQFINEYIKEREWYRPLAPSVLKEHVDEWFEPVQLEDSSSDGSVGTIPIGRRSSAIESPYMSVTARIRDEYQARIPAVCHIDNTARLQTVELPKTVSDGQSSEIDSISSLSEIELYHKLISQFHKKTGIPMVLNTSFNRKKQPIVETPAQAINTFLQCQGNLSSLYMGEWQITVRPFPLPLNAKGKQ